MTVRTSPRIRTRQASGLGALFLVVGGLTSAAGAADAAAPPPCGAPSGYAGPYNVIFGSDGPDTLTGTPGADVICGFDGRDEIHGQGGADIIYGGAQNDR